MSGSTKPGKRDLREERKARVAEMQAAERVRERRRSMIMWSTITAVIVALIAGVGGLIWRQEANRPSLDAVQTFTVDSKHVTTDVTYAQTPPAGGEHDAAWLNCGIYDTPVRDENAVHSMEHGAVWITYRADLPSTDVDTLKAAMPSTYAILSPFKDLKAPVVASAWGKQLELTGVNDARLKEFIKKYRMSADVPEPGAACTGGVDVTSQPTEG